MRVIIANHDYNTETDTLVKSWNNGLKPLDLLYEAEDLYRNRAGIYYLHIGGGACGGHMNAAGSEQIWYGQLCKPLTDSEAQDWLAKH